MKRRHFIQALSLGTLFPSLTFGGKSTTPDLPKSVAELWSDFDPRQDPLEIEVIREWRDELGLFKHVRFLLGNFKGTPARLAAIYGTPIGPNKMPAVMHIHGGGQRASLPEVRFLVSQGFAGLSINWGGSGNGLPPINQPDGFLPTDPNTDWGDVDPTQLNVPGYTSMQPGPKQFFEDREHPKNCNWYLLTLACRRGLTFLEQQPEVNASLLGIHGYSMGGNLTMYVAGCDERVKAAVPGVGGQGWRWQPHQFIEGTATQENIKGDLTLFQKTLSFESYAPKIRCPILHRSSTNDFHGWMDDVYRTNQLIPHPSIRYSWAPHLNHRLTPEVAVTLPCWFNHYLKNGPSLPATPQSTLQIDPIAGIPKFLVTPSDHSFPIARCEIYYSVDPDPRARFWRSANVAITERVFTASLPLHTLDLPLFAFANVYYKLPEPISMKELPGFSQPVEEICISSLLHKLDSQQLHDGKCIATASPSLLIDDFKSGLRDWYQLNAGNPTHLQTWTRKITDPMYRGPMGAQLKIAVTVAEPNQIAIVLKENEWRNYRGKREVFVARVNLQGNNTEQVITLNTSHFSTGTTPLTTWAHIDELGILAHYDNPGAAATEPRRWNGSELILKRVEWGM